MSAVMRMTIWLSPAVTPSEAFESLQTALRWLESQNADVEHGQKWQIMQYG